jgi:uncharacterized protein with FMN-binding domain
VRRIVLWGLSTFSALVLLLGYRTSLSSTLPTTGTGTASGSFASSATSSTTSSGASPPAGTPTATATAGTTSTERSVKGAVAQTRWGPVQVQLTVSGGRITKASVLQYPDGNGRDAEINDYALPILTKETVAAQGANIDMVSGATVSSDGYLESLQSALDQANL